MRRPLRLRRALTERSASQRRECALKNDVARYGEFEAFRVVRARFL